MVRPEMRSSAVLGSFSVATWNARVALVDDQVLARKKIVFFPVQQKRTHFLVQEMGGTILTMAHFVNKFKGTHFVGWSRGHGAA